MDSDHFSEDVIERFSMRKLEEPLLSEFEDHYLVCPRCQERVREMDAYLAAAQKALSRPQPASFAQRLWSILSQPVLRPVWPVAAIAGVLLFTFLPVQPRARQTVRLTSERGAPIAAAAPSSDLTLSLDLRGLETQPEIFAEVADTDGQPLWSGTALTSGTEATVTVSRRLGGGRYWVRIYRDQSRQDLLREYGLAIQ